MSTLLRRIRILEQLGDRRQRARAETASGQKDLRSFTEDELCAYLAICLDRPVADVEAMSDQELEQIATGKLH